MAEYYTMQEQMNKRDQQNLESEQEIDLDLSKLSTEDKPEQ